MAGAAAATAASALKQLHVRLAAPSAVWTTDGSFTIIPRGCVASGVTTTNLNKNPLAFPIISSPSSLRQTSQRFQSCAATRSTVEPPPLLYSSSQAQTLEPVTLYDVLGIPDRMMVTDEEIKTAFRRMAKKVHPDRAPPDQVKEYQKKFMEVHRAYSILKDPRTRSLYNYEIRNSVYNSKQFRPEDRKRPVWRGCNWETDQCWTS